MDEYAAGRTPNPCLRCNEKIKFAAVLDRALGARLRRGRDRPLRPAAHRRRRADRDAPGRRPRQGPVLRARRARPAAAARTRCSRSATPPSRRCARRRRARGLLVADKPDSHDICFVADGDNAGWLREKLGDRAPNHGGDDRRRRVRRGARPARGHLRLHDRPAQGAAARAAGARRQAAVRARHRAGLRHRDRRPARASSPSTGSPASGRAGAAPSRPGSPRRAPSSCAPTATSTAPSSTVDRTAEVEIELLDPAYGIAPGQAPSIYDGTRVVGSATIDATDAGSTA